MVYLQVGGIGLLQLLFSVVDQFFGQCLQVSEVLVWCMMLVVELVDLQVVVVEFGCVQMEIVQFSNDLMVYFSKMYLCIVLVSVCSNQFNLLFKNNGQVVVYCCGVGVVFGVCCL